MLSSPSQKRQLALPLSPTRRAMARLRRAKRGPVAAESSAESDSPDGERYRSMAARSTRSHLESTCDGGGEQENTRPGRPTAAHPSPTATHVDVRQLEVHHGCERREVACDELGRVRDKRGVEQVYSAEGEAGRCERLRHARHDGDVAVQLDLPGAVDEEVVVVEERVSVVGQPRQVLHEVFHAKNERTLRVNVAEDDSFTNPHQRNAIAAQLTLGPNCISACTSSTEMRSRMSNATGYLKCSAAGSKLATRTVRPLAAACCWMASQYVDFPVPAEPMTS